MRVALLWITLAAVPLMACGEEAPDAPPVIAPIGEGQVLRLTVTNIENPDMVPFGLILESADGVPLGRVAVFPPDQPGVFRLQMSETERALARDGVRVRIAPFGAGEAVTATTELAFE